jgi:hypothetical protein
MTRAPKKQSNRHGIRLSSALTLSLQADTLRPLESPWTEVRAAIRRVFLLQSAGRGADAQRMEDTELATAAARARAAFGAGIEADERFRAQLAEEKERVAGAIALAEVLAPMLSERLFAAVPALAPAAGSYFRRPGARAPLEARGIADYIDEMLALEREGSH